MVLAVSFPPTGGVGVIRTLKFIKYLPQFGWKPLVVTPPAGTKHIQDISLSVEIPQDIAIHRPPFFNYKNRLPKLIGKMFRIFEKRIYFPDDYTRWNKSAFNYISQHIIPKDKIDLIYTSVGPYSTMLLAHALKQHYQIPIFIDFRDPFSFNQYALLDKKKTFIKRAEKIEKKIFADVDQINNVSKIWKEKYENLYPEISTKSSLVHNGYDEEDFAGLNNVEKSKNQIFTIGYSGTFSRVVPIKPLILAIKEIHQRHGISMRLSIATPIKKEKLTSRYAYLFQNNLIDYKGFLPHKESLKNIYRSDISILILNDIAATEGMLPAKTFEYLRIGNPILLLHRKHSFLSEIIEKTKTGITADILSQDDIIQALLKLHERWRQNGRPYQPDWNEIKKYERKYLTQQLSAIFDQLSS
jgi:hypothetical protein